jgi:hypothetical protein
MTTRIFLMLVLALSAGLCWAQAGNKATEEKMIQTEKQLWEAWKNNNAEPFSKALAPNAVAITSEGPKEGLQPVVQDLMSGNCKVNSYSLENFKTTWINSNTALLTYKGNQDAVCEGQKVPSAVWASTIYVKRGNDWKAMFHQESPAKEAMSSRE